VLTTPEHAQRRERGNGGFLRFPTQGTQDALHTTFEHLDTFPAQQDAKVLKLVVIRAREGVASLRPGDRGRRGSLGANCNATGTRRMASGCRSGQCAGGGEAIGGLRALHCGDGNRTHLDDAHGLPFFRQHQDVVLIVERPGPKLGKEALSK
jgi:hypothetical protein